jgi:arylsulfatase
VTADHGDAFGEHDYYEHPRYLHDELIHVPLLIRAPDCRRERVSMPVSTLDIASTIKHLVGLESSFSLLDFSPAEMEEGRHIFSQARGENDNTHLRRYAVRSKDGAAFCKRDADTGVTEFTEVTSPDLRSKLQSHINKRTSIENGDTAVMDGEDDVNEAIEDRLEALGYKE